MGMSVEHASGVSCPPFAAVGAPTAAQAGPRQRRPTFAGGVLSLGCVECGMWSVEITVFNVD